MATETLGARILAASREWECARGLVIYAMMTGGDSSVPAEQSLIAWGDLRKLAARADAAERLAVAIAAERAALVSPAPYHGRGWAEAGEYTKARDKTDEALAAWRAITEVGNG